MRRVLTAIASLALVGAMATPAQADFNIATGLKWVPLRYTFPVGAGSEGANTNTAGVPGQWYSGSGGSMYGWQSTSLDNYIGFFFTEQVGLQLSLDLGWAAHNNDTTNAGAFSTSYFQFGLGVGGKFYLNRPSRERVSPYLFVNFFKYFASISSNDPGITNDVASALAGFHSPIGIDGAFGAEYFFTTSFSLGAEVLGVRFAHVQGDIPLQTGGRISTGESYVSLYTGISINYRFLATASVRTYEDEEDRQTPRPRRKPVRRPVEPPPEDDGRSPESVD